MTFDIRVLAGAACLWLAAGPARAQWAIPLYNAQLHASTGSWASYDMQDTDGGKVVAKGAFRVAVVEKEGKDYWLEAHFTRIIPPPPPGQEKADLKLLVDPAAPLKPKKTYVQTPAGLLDFEPFAVAIDSAVANAPRPTPLSDQGLETLSIGKKTYQVHKLADKNGWKTVYMKRGVGPYGVVKQIDSSGQRASTLTLSAYGTHANAELTGTPMRFPSGPGMPDIGQLLQKAMQEQAAQKPKEQPAPQGSGLSSPPIP